MASDNHLYLMLVGKCHDKIFLVVVKRSYSHSDFPWKKLLKKLQQKYVFVPTDKAADNITVVCKH